MRVFTVHFRSLRDVQEFVSICSRYNFPITVGTEGYHVNATSFMGMFSLNCRRPQRVMADCSQEEFDSLLQAVSRFLEP